MAEESKTVSNIILENAVQMFLWGLNENKKERPVRIREDGSIGVWPGLRDENQILWIRPYETLDPRAGVAIASAAPTTVFTSTGQKTRGFIDVVNNTAAQASITIERDVDGTGTWTNLVQPSTPIPTGIGFRIGHFDLSSGGIIRAQCDIDLGAIVYVTADAFDPVGP